MFKQGFMLNAFGNGQSTLVPVELAEASPIQSLEMADCLDAMYDLPARPTK